MSTQDGTTETDRHLISTQNGTPETKYTFDVGTERNN